MLRLLKNKIGVQFWSSTRRGWIDWIALIGRYWASCYRWLILYSSYVLMSLARQWEAYTSGTTGYKLYSALVEGERLLLCFWHDWTECSGRIRVWWEAWIYIGNDGSRGYSGRFGLLLRCSMAAATVFVIAFHCLPCLLLLWIRVAPLWDANLLTSINLEIRCWHFRS